MAEPEFVSDQPKTADPNMDSSPRLWQRRSVVRVGAITVLTGAVAATLYFGPSSVAYACDNPPCGPPHNPSPP